MSHSVFPGDAAWGPHSQGHTAGATQRGPDCAPDPRPSPRCVHTGSRAEPEVSDARWENKCLRAFPTTTGKFLATKEGEGLRATAQGPPS